MFVALRQSRRRLRCALLFPLRYTSTLQPRDSRRCAGVPTLSTAIRLLPGHSTLESIESCAFDSLIELEEAPEDNHAAPPSSSLQLLFLHSFATFSLALATVRPHSHGASGYARE
jgi:hypothetical protein